MMERLKFILSYLEKVQKEIDEQKGCNFECAVCLDCLAHIITNNYDELREFEEMHEEQDHFVIYFTPMTVDDITPIIKFLRWYLYSKVD